MADTPATQRPQPKATRARRSSLAQVRDTAIDRARSTVEGLEANPIGVLVGGLAFGLVAGAFIPRSDAEKKALRPVGKRLAEGAGAALAAAKDTGKEQLSAAMLGKDAAKEGARKVFDSAFEAAKGSRADAPAKAGARSGTASAG